MSAFIPCFSFKMHLHQCQFSVPVELGINVRDMVGFSELGAAHQMRRSPAHLRPELPSPTHRKHSPLVLLCHTFVNFPNNPM